MKFIKRSVLVGFLICAATAKAQDVDPDLATIKVRLDSIEQFKADLLLEVAIDFINMPPKTAEIVYQKGEPMEFKTSDFMLIPKKGLDFSLQQLFEYSFFTVLREELSTSKNIKVLNLIPTDTRADFSIATLYLDTQQQRILTSEIATKKNGTYTIAFSYANDKDILPSKVVVSFEIDRIKIPLNFIGKDIDVDRKKMKAQEIKTGAILLFISNYQFD